MVYKKVQMRKEMMMINEMHEGLGWALVQKSLECG